MADNEDALEGTDIMQMQTKLPHVLTVWESTGKMMSAIIGKVNVEQAFTIPHNTRSIRCPRKW